MKYSKEDVEIIMNSTGGMAFPMIVNDTFYMGMTLRDYFAGQALAGEIRDAKIAYMMADEMLKEREFKK